MAQVGYSETLGHQLRKEEAKLTEARARLADHLASESAEEPEPDPAEARHLFQNITEAMETAPERAREALRRLLTPVTLTPAVEDDGEVYEAVGAIKLNPVAHLGDRVLVTDGCGGRI